MTETEKNIDFSKLDKFEKINDSTLTEISESELLNSGKTATNDTNVEDTPQPQQGAPNQQTANEPKKQFDFKHEPSGNASAINLATFLSPELVTEAIDALVPLMFVYGLSAVKISIKKNQLQLSPKEKETILPLVDECLKELNILIKSPFVALGIMLAIFYGSKAVEHGIKAQEVKRAESDGKPATSVKDTRGRKKGTTKEVIEKRAQAQNG